MPDSVQPDWEKIAEKFDLWLPQLKPVGDALIEALAAQANEAILDVASGTGEPALTLAHSMDDAVKITGTDAAPAMAQVAQRKVDEAGLENIRFQAMASEQLGFADRVFDRVLSRFGVMLFDDPLAGMKEIHRVLKPGGRFVFAVWGTPEDMPTMLCLYEAVKDRLAEEFWPPMAKVTSLGEREALAQLLETSGFDDYRLEKRRFDYQFATFADYWQTLIDSEIMQRQLDALTAAQQQEVYEAMRNDCERYLEDEGLRIPHGFWLAVANK